jgi:hypothetical protein
MQGMSHTTYSGRIWSVGVKCQVYIAAEPPAFSTSRVEIAQPENVSITQIIHMQTVPVDSTSYLYSILAQVCDSHFRCTKIW